MKIQFINESTNDCIEFFIASDVDEAAEVIKTSSRLIEDAINQNIVICLKKQKVKKWQKGLQILNYGIKIGFQN